MRWLRVTLPLMLAAAAPIDRPTTLPDTLDLQDAFHTRTPWTLTTTRGAPTPDPSGLDSTIPGIVTTCLHAASHAGCDPVLRQALIDHPGQNDIHVDPHELVARDIVRLPGPFGQALLLVKTASAPSINGDRLILTQILAYDRPRDHFVSVFATTLGRNNNQDVALMTKGSLRGDVITIVPTADAPFGYWITVSAPWRQASRPILRYRSVTRYNDGNPLPVMMSDMPTMLHRLGLVSISGDRPESCPRPRVVLGELWCSARE